MSLLDPALELADDLVEQPIAGIAEERDRESSIVDACRHGNPTHLILLRIMSGESVNTIHNGLTPLLAAIYRDDVELMKLLIHHKADINRCSALIPSPIWFSIMHRKVAATEYLLTLSPDLESPPSVFYLRAFKNIREFAEKIGFDPFSSSTSSSSSSSSSSEPSELCMIKQTVVHEFSIPIGKPKYINTIVTEFVCDGILFGVKFFRGFMSEAAKKTANYCEGNTGVYIGLAGEIIPSDYVVRFIARLDLKPPHSKWHLGMPFIAEITPTRKDWGFLNFENASKWNILIGDFYEAEARVILSLLHSEIDYE